MKKLLSLFVLFLFLTTSVFNAPLVVANDTWEDDEATNETWDTYEATNTTWNNEEVDDDNDTWNDEEVDDDNDTWNDEEVDDDNDTWNDEEVDDDNDTWNDEEVDDDNDTWDSTPSTSATSFYGLSSSSVSSYFATVSWKYPSSSTKFKVCYKATGDAEKCIAVDNKKSYQLTDLDSGIKYTWYVETTNLSTNKKSSEQTFWTRSGSGGGGSSGGSTSNSLPRFSSISSSVATGGVVTISWEASDTKNTTMSYKVCYRANSTGTYTCTTSTTSKSITLPSLVSNTSYQYYVEAKNDRGTTDSEKKTFNTNGNTTGNRAPKVNIIEVQNLRATSATLVWNGYDEDLNDELTYTVCFGTSESSMTNCSETKAESKLISSLIPNKVYYWTVRVRDTAGATASASTMTFTTNTTDPSNRLPSISLTSTSSITSTSARLRYNATDSDTSNLTVELCVSTDRNNLPSNCIYQTTDKSSYTVENLLPGTTYYWTARVSDGTYLVFSEDAPFTFTTSGTLANNAPYAMLVDGVSTGATTATLRWTGVDMESDTLSYQVCYATSYAAVQNNCSSFTANGGSTSSPVNPTTHSYSISGLQVNTPYYWNVRVKDASHEFAPSSNGPFSFITGTSNGLPSVTLTQVTSPVTTDSVTLRWVGSNATSYNVYFGTSNPPALYRSNVTDQFITIPSLTSGTYYWNVVAVNGSQTATAVNGPSNFTVTLGGGITPPVTPVISENNDIRYMIYTASSISPYRAKTIFTPSETVRYVLRVENLSATQTQTINLPSGDEVRFAVANSMGNTVYTANSNTHSSTVTLAPGEYEDFYAETPASTAALETGLYTVTPTFLGTNVNLPTMPTMQFRVVSTTDAGTNYAPQVTLLTPANNSVVSGGSALLKWFGFDPNGDALTYTVYFGTNSNPTNAVSTSEGASYLATGLVNGTTYYWTVTARDTNGLTSQTVNGTFVFTTQTATQNPSVNDTYELTVLTKGTSSNNQKSVFVQGEDVKVELQVRNITNQTKTLTASTQMSIAVMNTAGTTLYSTLGGYNACFTGANTGGSITFDPGEIKTYSATWTQRGFVNGYTGVSCSTSASQLPNGNYVVSATLQGANGLPAAPTRALTITSSTNNPNVAPTGTLTSPADNSVVNNTSVPLLWTAQDANGDTLTYDVYVSTSSTNLTGTSPVATGLSNPNYNFSATANTRYYWTVRAKDTATSSFAANGPFSFYVNPNGTTTVNSITTSLVIKNASGVDTTTFAYGENITFQLLFANSSAQDQVLTFASSKMFDFVLTNSNGQVVWQSSRGQNFTQGQTSITVPASKTVKVGEYVWNRADNNGVVVPAGLYTITGNNFVTNGVISAPQKNIGLQSQSTSGGGGGGGYSSGGSGGGGSNVDTTTPTTIPAKDTGEFLTVYGPLKFNLSNGVATVPIKHMDVGNGVSVQYEKGTKVTLADGSMFTGTIYTPACYTTNKLPQGASTSIPNGYTSLYDCYIQYGSLAEKFDPMLRIFGDLSRDITTKVSQPSNLAIMFWDPETKKWTNIGGYSNFKGKRFDTYIKKSGVIGFFDTHAAGGSSVDEGSDDCTTFADTQYHWAKDVICTLESRGVVSGYTTALFRPDRPMTRAELVKIVLKLNGKSVAGVTTTGVFPDISGNEWYAPYVVQAKNLGIVTGYGDGYFRPNQYVNRAEAMKIILRGTNGVSQNKIDEEQITQMSDGDDYSYFQDVRETDWFSRYVAYSFKRGIISGKADGLFHGEQFATRAELSKITLMVYEFPTK